MSNNLPDDSDEELSKLLEHISSVEPPPLTETLKAELKDRISQRSDDRSNDDGLINLKPSTTKLASEPISVNIDEPPEPKLLPKLETLPAPAEVMKPAVPTDEIGQELASQFKSSISRVNEITDEVIAGYQSDRLQAQKAIDHFFTVIDMGGKTARVYVEKLPDILRVKNEIATNAIKLLDSITKFMAATKGNNMLVQNTNPTGINMDDLAAILSQSSEKYEDEQD